MLLDYADCTRFNDNPRVGRPYYPVSGGRGAPGPAPAAAPSAPGSTRAPRAPPLPQLQKRNARSEGKHIFSLCDWETHERNVKHTMNGVSQRVGQYVRQAHLRGEHGLVAQRGLPPSDPRSGSEHPRTIRPGRADGRNIQPSAGADPRRVALSAVDRSPFCAQRTAFAFLWIIEDVIILSGFDTEAKTAVCRRE